MKGLKLRLMVLKRRASNFWRLYRTSKLGLAGLAIIVGYVILAVAAPYITPYDPFESVALPFEEPSPEHPLGTDHLGRDLLSELIYGTRVSLMIGLAASFISVMIGTTVGLIAGFFGGKVDTVLMRLTDTFIQMPQLPLMLIFVSILGKGILNIVLAISVVAWTASARIARSLTLSLKERPFVEAARAVGAGSLQILWRHIVPNVFPVIFAYANIAVVDAILSESFLSFIGFGDPRTPSWGMILYFASRSGAMSNGFWWFVIPPGLMIMTLALGFAITNYSLDQILNPRLRRR